VCSKWCVLCVGQCEGYGGVNVQQVVCVLCVGQFGGGNVQQVTCVVCGTVWGRECAAGGVLCVYMCVCGWVSGWMCVLRVEEFGE
jgi:hypothetical protein